MILYLKSTIEKSFKLLICYKKVLIYFITGIIRKIIVLHIQGLKKHSRYPHGMKEILKYIVYSSQKFWNNKVRHKEVTEWFGNELKPLKSKDSNFKP